MRRLAGIRTFIVTFVKLAHAPLTALVLLAAYAEVVSNAPTGDDTGNAYYLAGSLVFSLSFLRLMWCLLRAESLALEANQARRSSEIEAERWRKDYIEISSMNTKLLDQVRRLKEAIYQSPGNMN